MSADPSSDSPSSREPPAGRRSPAADTLPPPRPPNVPPPLPPPDPARQFRANRRARAPGTPPPLPSNAELQRSAARAAENLRRKRADELLDEAELARFKNLVVFARTLVQSRYSGRHKSPDLGGGGEFAEFQAYFPGLPVSAIDWRVWARDRRLVIRRYREETDMDVHLVVDASGSMAYGGGGREDKGLRVARIAAALAYLMMRQGDKVSLTLFADRVLDHLPPGGTRRHLLAALRALVKPAHEATGGTDVAAALHECERLFKRRGRIVVLSDFLGGERQALFDALGRFAHRGFEILLMQLMDPDELTLPDAPLARFVDMETGETVEVEPAEIRDDYQRHIAARRRGLADECARHGVDFTGLETSGPYREAIEAYLGFRRPGR